MALLNLDLNLSNDYTNILKNIYKFSIILILFQIFMVICCKNKKLNLGLTGKILNTDFIQALLLLILAYLGYELVFKEILLLD